MAKTSLEKAIEKANKQAKADAKRQRDAEKRRSREEQRNAERRARQEAIRTQASSIVCGQETIEGIRIMDRTSEEVLEVILGIKEDSQGNIEVDSDMLPQYVQNSLSLEMEKLLQYGIITSKRSYMGGALVQLSPSARSYFKDKEDAIKAHEERGAKMSIGSIVNTGNLIIGDVKNSTFSIDNSITYLEKEVAEKGGEDKEVLLEILEDVKEYLENIENTRALTSNKKLFNRITDHASKHGWFYGALIQLIGTTVLTTMG